MTKRLILILTIITILLCIGTVNAEQVTIKVDEKQKTVEVME